MTLFAEVQLRGYGGSTDVPVTVEAARGRIEIDTYYWRPARSGRYLSIGVGTTVGDDDCAVQRRVVVDTSDPETAKVYDGDGVRVPQTQQFTVPRAWAHVARVGVAPFAEVDCVEGASYARRDPTDHGPRIWGSPTYDLEDRFVGVLGFPLGVSCPRTVAWEEELTIDVRLNTDPGRFPSSGVLPHPSVITTSAVTVAPGAYEVVSVPELPSDVDTWTTETWTGTLVLDPDDAELDRVRASGDLAADGDTARWSCTTRVLLPAPTDWTGTLAGTTWWDTDRFSGPHIGGYGVHRTFEFLDDEWVFVSEEYVGAHTRPCTTVPPRSPYGCHRYYYDEATNRIQVDDRLGRWTEDPGYWVLPGGGRYGLYFPSHVVLPARTGERFDYRGESRWGELRLRPDGTYRYQGRHPAHDRQVRWAGRYRFVGGDAQRLVLDHGGSTFRADVQLYFIVDDDGRTLFDIDTPHRTFRFELV